MLHALGLGTGVKDWELLVDIVEEAMRRRDLLVAELARLDQFLETAKMLRAGSPQRLEEAAKDGIPTRSVQRDLTAVGIIGVVSDVLRSTGHPLARGELYRRLLDVGVQVSGEDPVKNLGTMLWRSGKFDNTGRLYWFKGEPRPNNPTKK